MRSNSSALVVQKAYLKWTTWVPVSYTHLDVYKRQALIGSVADWFAVTALFRKPLGFPYHTALIPRNKDRLINGVIKLVETKMLTKDRCKVLLNNVEFVPLFEKFLLSPEGQRAARLVIHQGLHLLWKSQTVSYTHLMSYILQDI